jgi:apyrase
MVGHGLRGRPESLRERLWRFRSILLLVSIPVALFALVLLFMPSSLAPLPTGERRYAVVVDAGSTGSRVHAFAFSASRNGGLELLSDTFEQLKPGLSSFADTPAEGAASLRPLLEKALAAIPASAHSSTPVEVRATAGLRLLPGDKAEQLLSGTSLGRGAARCAAGPLTRTPASAVRELLHAYPFEFNQGSVSILDGAQEGAFQWLTLNYLLGNLEKGVAVRFIAPCS